jgi:RNA polymerase sigma-70 factor, ECF subfamily
MEQNPQHTVTRLLQQWQNGNSDALSDLIPIVYDELYRLAHHYLKGEKTGHTLQTTDIINEAIVRLMDEKTAFANRSHFIAILANTMRRVLVDYARKKRAQKRDGGFKVTLSGAAKDLLLQDIDLINLNEALNKLEAIDPMQMKIVELRFFCGFSIEETATILGISQTAIKAEWSIIRAWLYRELN